MKIMSLALQLTLLWASSGLQEAIEPNKPPILTFQVSPLKRTFSGQEDILLRFELHNNSKDGGWRTIFPV